MNECEETISRTEKENDPCETAVVDDSREIEKEL